MTSLSNGDRIKAEGRIDLPGIEPGRTYKVVGRPGLEHGTAYRLKPDDGGPGNPKVHLASDIDASIKESGSEKPYFKVLKD